MVNPIIFVLLNHLRGDDEEREKEFPYLPEVAGRLYAGYRALLKELCAQNGLHEWIGQETTDPWCPGLHYICRTERRKRLGWISYNQDVAVAEIESEPVFAEQDMPDPQLCYNGLEFRVIDPNVRPLIDKFCQQYEQMSDEKAKVNVPK